MAAVRPRLQTQLAKISFLQALSGLSLTDSFRSSVIREGLRLEPLVLGIQRWQLRWSRHLSRMPPGQRGVSGMSYWGEAPGQTQDTVGRLCLLGGLNARHPPGAARGGGWAERSGHLCLKFSTQTWIRSRRWMDK